MHVHRPKALHSPREFLGEVAVIIVGILIAIGLEQGVEALRWRHEVAEARRALGQEVAYNLQALRIMQVEDACIQRRLDQLAMWAGGSGPRPTEPYDRPILFTPATSTWDVANSGQVVAHFPLDQKMRFAHAYASVTNERDTIAEERSAWETIASIASDQVLDDADRRDLRHAVGLARTIRQRRRGNSDLILRESRSLATEGPGLAPPDNRFASAFCSVVG